MSRFKELYRADISRYGGGISESFKQWFWLFRKAQTVKNPILKKVWNFFLMRKGKKYGIEIGHTVDVGPGLYIGHPFGITINGRVKIGRNCNIHKGCTIGQENRGIRKGIPVIGDNVWIGVNSTIVGNIQVGNDVLIAPNTYVNCNVPDHSIAIGSPCRIIHRDNATESYISNKV